MSDIPKFNQLPKNLNGSPLSAVVEGLGDVGIGYASNIVAKEQEKLSLESDLMISDALFKQRTFYQNFAKTYIDKGDLEGLKDVLQRNASELTQNNTSERSKVSAILQKETQNLILSSQKQIQTKQIEKSQQQVLQSLENLTLNPASEDPRKFEQDLKALMSRNTNALFGEEESKKILKNARMRLYQNTILQSDPEQALKWIDASEFDAVDKERLGSFVRNRAGNAEKISKSLSEIDQQNLLRGGDVQKIKEKNQDLYESVLPIIGQDSDFIEKKISETTDPELKKRYTAFLSGQTQALYNDPLGYASKSDIIVPTAIDFNNPDWEQRSRDAMAVQAVYGATSMFDATDKKMIIDLLKNEDYSTLSQITDGAIKASRATMGNVSVIMDELNTLKPELGTDLVMASLGNFDFAQLQNAKSSIPRADFKNSLENTIFSLKGLFDQMPDEGKRMITNFTYMQKFTEPKKIRPYWPWDKELTSQDLFDSHYESFGKNEYFAERGVYSAPSFKRNAIKDIQSMEQFKDFPEKDLVLKNTGIDKYVLGYSAPNGFGFYGLKYYTSSELQALSFN